MKSFDGIILYYQSVTFPENRKVNGVIPQGLSRENAPSDYYCSKLMSKSREIM